VIQRNSSTREKNQPTSELNHWRAGPPIAPEVQPGSHEKHRMSLDRTWYECLTHWSRQRWVAGFAIVLLLVALRGAELLNERWSNMGMVALAQAMSADMEAEAQEMASRAELSFRQAIELGSEDRSDWRGLGFSLAVQGRGEDAVAAWQISGEMANEFLQWGDHAQGANQYQDALIWYERAAEVESETGDAWYYAGLMYEKLEQWEKALEAYERALAANGFADVSRSSAYYRMGMIYQWRLDSRQTDAALTAYEMAIEVDDFDSDWERADSHFRRGQILWWTGGDPAEYVDEYQITLRLNPGHASAHMLLGVAFYAQYQDLDMAERELLRALELAPKNAWAHVYLGDVYFQEGMLEKAKVMYQLALDISPDLEEAKERLISVQASER
jgi:tetratricopeptide (TPR) repeat protein